MEQVFKFAIEALSDVESIARKPVRTIQQGMDILTSLHAYITTLASDPKKQYTASLLKGSVATFNIIIAQALARTDNEETNLSLYQQCMEKFFDFIETAKEIVQEDLLKEDKSSHNLKEIMETTP